MKAIIFFTALFSVSMSSFGMQHDVTDCPAKSGEARESSKWNELNKDKAPAKTDAKVSTSSK